jgi:ribA/ribD-fused uncharacterized protein
MRKAKKRRLATTKVQTDKVYFYDRISHPKTYMLSPFFICKFYLDEKWWSSVIQYYQANKFPVDSHEYEQICDCKSPEEAKKIGSSVSTDFEWDARKNQLMRDASYAKFSQNKQCMNILIMTGTKQLIEDSHDPYWGGKNRGYNMMGKILMDVRTEIRQKLRLQ